MPTRANFPSRKRKRQDEAIERITTTIPVWEKLIKEDPNNDECKDHLKRLQETIVNTKKKLR